MSQYGIVITGGLVPPRSIIDMLSLEPSSIICADSGYDNAVALNMVPNAIVGDMDSVQSTIPPDIPTAVHNTEKDNTDTELAIEYAIQHGCKPIILVGGGSGEGRVDHFLALYHLFHRPVCHIHTWITDTAYITYHTVGTYHLKCTIGETISIFGCGNNVCHATSSGLQWPLDAITWSVSTTAGVSNRTSAKNIMLNVECGALLVVRTITAMTALQTAYQSS